MKHLEYLFITEPQDLYSTSTSIVSTFVKNFPPHIPMPLRARFERFPAYPHFSTYPSVMRSLEPSAAFSFLLVLTTLTGTYSTPCHIPRRIPRRIPRHGRSNKGPRTRYVVYILYLYVPSNLVRTSRFGALKPRTAFTFLFNFFDSLS